MENRSASQKRILLGQLGSYGDCLYATTVARQIKQDFPGSTLTWAVGSMYADVLDQNPHDDYASMKTDHACFGLPTGHIIEMADDDPGKVIACCLASLGQGHEWARARFDEATPVSYVFYFDCLRNHVRNGGKMSDLFKSITITRARFGWSLRFVRDVILKSIKLALETLVSRRNQYR